MAHVADEVIQNKDLEEWKLISSGGFGSVYKARHKTWGLDLAVKLLHHYSRPAEGEALNKEANRMKTLNFEFVVRIYGIYDGTPPFEKSMQQGIVMEFMRGGSIETLQKELDSPPPLPLAFRLAHQVALGVNFLHSKGVLHCDLKPSNVLLTGELNAKLADFGLSRVSTSVLNNNENTAGENGGTYKYMPPEAFSLLYDPVRSFDIYSYGVLLWSIFTGQEPYPGKSYSLVAMRIPKGDRPKAELCLKEEEGLEDLVKLITQCWDGNPRNRPKSEALQKDTKVLFSKHESKVNAAVYEVLTKLVSQSENQPSPSHTPEKALPDDVVDHSGLQPVQGCGGAGAFSSSEPVRSMVHLEQVGGPSLVQHRDIQDQQPCMDTPKTSDSVCLTEKQKATFVDNKKPDLIQRTTHVMAIVEQLGTRVHPETYSGINAIKTPQGQMRELFMTALRSGGDAVKAAFYDALKTHEPDLMMNLGG